MSEHTILWSHVLARAGSKTWRSRAAAFGQDSSGAVAMIFGLAAVMLFIAVGAAVDYGRWHNAKSRTLAAIDAAALATGRALQTNGGDQGKAKTVGERYFTQATATLLKVNNKNIDLQFTENGTAIVATSKATINTPFLSLAGFHDFPLFVQGNAGEPDITKSGAEYAKAVLNVGGNSKTSMEISLMLDVTGSMCDDNIGPCVAGTKIDALKAAASDLVNIVVWDNQNAYTSKVALVPFSTRVRVGPDGGGAKDDDDDSWSAMKKLTNLDDKWNGWYNECTSATGGGGSESGGNWSCSAHQVVHENNWKIMPCVVDRTGPQALTDAAPGSNMWLNAHGGDRMPVSWDSSDTPAPDHTGKNKTDPAEHWNYNSDGSCADVSPPDTILPLTSNKAKLLQRISGLEAYGATGGQLGTAFAWYMLSPNWDGVWPSKSQPAPYSDLAVVGPTGEPKLKKIAILMTDGSYNTWRGWKDQNQATVSQNARTLCSNMKAKGITVYTVGFNLDGLPAGEKTEATSTLQSCSTNAQSFYNTSDAEQLKQAFRDIALKISTLHIAN